MSSLLEAAAALAISGAVMVLVTASLAAATRVQAACVELAEDLFRMRQLEHLIDRTTLAAGAGPTHPEPIASLSEDTVVFASDHDGDGTIEETSAETTALEVRRVDGEARVRVRLGRQTMTVLQADDCDATLTAVDRRGYGADATTATLVQLTIAARGAASGDPGPSRLLFSVPARTAP